MTTRSAFTLIELMIVIAILAIVASIAVPNLLESRVTSQEAAASAALRSGLLPAQVQFQAGGYADRDGNGLGTFCVEGAQGVAHPYDTLSGTTTLSGLTLTLIPPAYSGAQPVVSGYTFATPVSDVAPAGGDDACAERVWAAKAYPADNHQGRRFFVVNQAGRVYTSRPSGRAFDGVLTVGGRDTPLTSSAVFGISLAGTPSASAFSVQQ